MLFLIKWDLLGKNSVQNEYLLFLIWCLVTPGNPQRCDSMIAKRSIQLWVCLPREFLFWLSFFLRGSVKDKLASAKSFQ